MFGALTSLTGGGGLGLSGGTATSGHAGIGGNFEFAPTTGGSGMSTSTMLVLGVLLVVAVVLLRK